MYAQLNGNYFKSGCVKLEGVDLLLLKSDQHGLGFFSSKRWFASGIIRRMKSMKFVFKQNLLAAFVCLCTQYNSGGKNAFYCVANQPPEDITFSFLVVCSHRNVNPPKAETFLKPNLKPHVSKA